MSFATVAAIVGIGGTVYNAVKKPSTPDIAGAAAQQGQDSLLAAQQQALLNNPNIVNPFGSSQWSGPTDGSGRPTVTQTLSPAEQAKLDKTQQLQLSTLGILGDNQGMIKDALSSGFGTGSKAYEGYDPKYAPTGTTQTGLKVPGVVQTSLNLPGSVQTGLNFDGAPGMPQADARVLQQVEDAMYGQNTQYLDPQYKQSESDIRSRLANQGIVPGTEAYDREMLNFNNTKQKAYSDARNSSIVGGQDAMQKLFNEAMASRQQGTGEIAKAGEFANTAQNQLAQQATVQGQFNNTAQQQQANNELLKFNANNSGVAQQAQIASNETGLANSGQNQNFNQNVTSATTPLNMYNSLLTSSQVNNPQYPGTAPTTIAPPPTLAGSVYQGQADAAASSANQGLWGNAVGALSGVAKANTAAGQTPWNPFSAFTNTNPGLAWSYDK